MIHRLNLLACHLRFFYSILNNCSEKMRIMFRVCVVLMIVASHAESTYKINGGKTCFLFNTKTCPCKTETFYAVKMNISMEKYTYIPANPCFFFIYKSGSKWDMFSISFSPIRQAYPLPLCVPCQRFFYPSTTLLLAVISVYSP